MNSFLNDKAGKGDDDTRVKDRDTYRKNFDNIFRKKKKKTIEVYP
jgi:hypothetical protein